MSRIFAALLALLLLAPLAAAATPSDLLRTFGVVAPSVEPQGKLVAEDVVSIEVSVATVKVGGAEYARLMASSSHGEVFYTGFAGGPRLPALHLTYRLPGSYAVTVEVKPLDAHVMPVYTRVEPNTKLLTYCGSTHLEVDNRLYEAATPGILYTYYVVREDGDTVVHVYVYPVQHKSGKLLVVDRLLVRVYGEPVKPLQEGGETVLVLARTYDLAKFAAKLVKEVHPEATVIPAGLENVTLAPPLPPQKPIPGVMVPLVEPPEALQEHYNFTLAMKVRGFIALMHMKYGVKYVLIVGGALDIPPSYYYLSLIELWVDYTYNPWIPTDYLYADLDLDMHPDVYVGRIPVSDPELLTLYFEKVRAYQELQKQPTALLIGGYPFAYVTPLGEAMLAEYGFRGFTSRLLVDYMTRSLGNYTRTEFKRLFLKADQPAWILVIAHGNGDLWADRVYNETLDAIMWEDLLTAREVLLNATKRDRLAIVTSVACMNGAWDTDLMPPLWFSPPSIGEAIVTGYGGVAYIGHARVAFDWYTATVVTAEKGVLRAHLGGATLLHGYLLKAWNDGAETLGEAFYRAIEEYLATPEANAFIEIVLMNNTFTLGFTTVMQLALLGDPLIRLPEPLEKPKPAPSLVFEGYAKLEDYVLFRNPLEYNGTVPVYTPATPKLVFTTSGLRAVAAVRVTSMYGSVLTGFKRLLVARVGGVEYSISLNTSVSGDLLVAVVTDSGYILASVEALGLHVAILGDGKARVVAWGLDLISEPGYPVEVYLGGYRLAITYDVGLDTLAPLPKYAGRLVAKVVPREPPSWVVYSPEFSKKFARLLDEYFSEHVSLRLVRSLELAAPSYVQGVGGKAELLATTLLDGRVVPAKVSVEAEAIIGSKPSVKLQEVKPGVYRLIVEAEPGVYLVTVKADYASGGLEAHTVRNIIVVIDMSVEEAYRGLSKVVEEKTGEAASKVIGSIEALGKTVSEKLAGIEKNVLDVMAETKDVRSIVESGFASLKDVVEKSKSEVIEALRSETSGINARMAKLESRVASLGESITTKIEEATASIKKSISESSKSLGDRISSKLDEMKESLSSEISGTSAKVNMNIALTSVTLAAAAIAAGAGIRSMLRS